MSDLPLDETALQAAEKAMYEARPYPRNALSKITKKQREDVRKETIEAISTYLRKAGIGVEVVPAWTLTDPDGARHLDGEMVQRFVSPWKLVPVVQAESEEE
jgi:hypothetical protein